MTKIIHKKSSVASKVPLVGDLDYGELALNYQDGKLFYKAADNTIKSISSGGGTADRLTNFTSYPTTDVTTDNVDSCVGYINGVSLLGQTEGALYSHVYSSAWKHNIYGDYRTGQIAVRAKNNNAWGSWRVVLDSSNYTSYAPSTTGTGASGTWGISINGTAANVTGTVAIANGGTGATSATNALTNLGALPLTGGTLTGNLTFSGARKITGDFSTSTVANRLLFQTSSTDSNTFLSIIPNGIFDISGIEVYNNSATINVAYGTLRANSTTDIRVASLALGTGTVLPLRFVVGTTMPASMNTNGSIDIINGLRENKVLITVSNDINTAAGNYFTKTISGATTFTVSNVGTTNAVGTSIATSFILDLTNGGSATITWWGGIKWVGGTAPTLTSAGRDVLGFFTHDSGTTWTGLVLGKDVK